MFGFFKSKTSLVRQRLKAMVWVRRAWFEWAIENGRRESILVVETDFELDPNSPDFDPERLDEIAAVIAGCATAERPPDRVRVIPRMYET